MNGYPSCDNEEMPGIIILQDGTHHRKYLQNKSMLPKLMTSMTDANEMVDQQIHAISHGVPN